MKRYWMIHNGKENCPTKTMHETFELACQEAQRLASANPGNKFAVLEMMCYYQVEFPAPKFNLPEKV